MGLFVTPVAGVIIPENLSMIDLLRSKHLFSVRTLYKESQKEVKITIVVAYYRHDVEEIHSILSNSEMKNIEWLNVNIHSCMVDFTSRNVYYISNYGKYID